MPLIKIKLAGDTCQVLEQTERIDNGTTSIFKASNGKRIYCFDYPDYIASSSNIYLRGSETDKDFHVFGYDKDYLTALDEFCKHFEWRFVICI